MEVCVLETTEDYSVQCKCANVCLCVCMGAIDSELLQMATLSLRHRGACFMLLSSL